MQDQANNIYNVLSSFLQTAQQDVRITSMHISVYCALFEQWLEQGCVNPFAITRKKIMGLSKISVASYHKVISELQAFGYILYSPSYHPAKGSTVDLVGHEKSVVSQFEKKQVVTLALNASLQN